MVDTKTGGARPPVRSRRRGDPAVALARRAADTARVPPSHDLLARIARLRELFLAEDRGGALADYWRAAADVAAYDAVLGARIGWKWDAALAECQDRGWARSDGERIVDFGCGSGVAARAYAQRFGAGRVRLVDRSRTAAQWAADALRAACPAVPTLAASDPGSEPPDVLLVSHVLGELDAAGEQRLEALARRSRRVLWVEPGSKQIARRLSALRDRLTDAFSVQAPCPHQGPCPALASPGDWCHFFAPPPAAVFTDGDWAHYGRALGIDLRALPYAFVALVRRDAAAAPAPPSPPPPHRLLGRVDVGKHDASAQACTAAGLTTLRVPKRTQPELWRALKKHPEGRRELPPA
jgi:SAM-dependent methyltransferase